MATSDFDISTVIDQTPLFSQQWYLNNFGQTGGTPGADANIIDAWSTATGEGVVIGIVDNFIQHTHPDLNDNFDPLLSVGTLNDPFNIYTDNHGTLVAGIAVGEGDNNVGIIGAAPDATFASLPLLNLNSPFLSLPNDFFNPSSLLSHRNQEIDIYSNSWAPAENFVNLEADLNAIETSIQVGRGGLGSIYVFAAGNNGELAGNVNYQSVTNSRYTITVGAIDHNGQQTSYSNPGASLLISGYSGNEETGITSTDNISGSNGDFINGTYNPNFSGTSASTPLVSGVIALMLEANPNLTWRDVQHILVETAEVNDSSDLGWVRNGAGHDVNHNYGFGAIDATSAVSAAQTWQNVAEEVSVSSGRIDTNSAIPDNNFSGVSSSFTVAQDIDLEWVEIVFDADHSYRGDLEIVLTSPDGTESILAEQRFDSEDNYDNWVFTSARHWGESSQGEWTLSVSDEAAADIGIWNSWQLNFYGTENIPQAFNPINDSDSNSETSLDTSIYRFQSNVTPGTYVFVGEAERQNINRNFADSFNEEGVAFRVGSEPGEDLEPLYRFQSNVTPGTYVFVGEDERRDINRNFSDSFTEEGVAFYVYESGSGLGQDFSRFHNLDQPGTYTFATGAERDNILADFPNFVDEGFAFAVDV